MPDPIQANLRDFARAVEREAQLSVRTMIPAKVLAYSAAKQQVKVELGTIEVRKHQDGTETEQAPVVLEKVPVMHTGDLTSYIVHPIAAESHGMVLICDRSLAAWRTDGNAHAPSLPQLHNLADAVFLPGLRPDPSPLPVASMGGMALEAATIQLGAGATQPALLGSLFTALWTAMVAYMNSHTHPVPGVTPGLGATVSSPPSSPLVSNPNPLLSSKVFVE